MSFTKGTKTMGVELEKEQGTKKGTYQKSSRNDILKNNKKKIFCFFIITRKRGMKIDKTFSSREPKPINNLRNDFASNERTYEEYSVS